MTKLLAIARGLAKAEPEDYFRTPKELSQEPGMTRGEKIATLRGWAFDVQRRLDASAEGLLPDADPELPRSSQQPDDAELLRQIELEIAGLENGYGEKD